MAVDPEKRIFSCDYHSDDGTHYIIGVKGNHAAANGAVNPTSDRQFPKRWKPRCVHGVDATGLQKVTLVIPNPSNPLWTTNITSFTVPELGDFLKTGSTGERRSRPGPTIS
jgi:hypothetical protein